MNLTIALLQLRQLLANASTTTYRWELIESVLGLVFREKCQSGQGIEIAFSHGRSTPYRERRAVIESFEITAPQSTGKIDLSECWQKDLEGEGYHEVPYPLPLRISTENLMPVLGTDDLLRIRDKNDVDRLWTIFLNGESLDRTLIKK